MKTFSALVAVYFLGCAVVAQAAEPPPDRDQQETVVLTKEVQDQQKAIAENQTKINEKLVGIAEALRIAKIYASRGGK